MRHHQDILNLYGAYFKCLDLHETKCNKPECQKAKEETKEEKERMKNAAKWGVLAVGAVGVAAAAPELLPLLPTLEPVLEPVLRGAH
jgi:hypothetical protein